MCYYGIAPITMCYIFIVLQTGLKSYIVLYWMAVLIISTS